MWRGEQLSGRRERIVEPSVIGVLATKFELPLVSEFFELFKTAWEPYQPDHTYSVLICSSCDCPATSARLILRFDSKPGAFDRKHGIQIRNSDPMIPLETLFGRLPLYGSSAVFDLPNGWTMDGVCPGGVAIVMETEDQVTIRIGFNLFDEFGRVLQDGQPVEFAAIPSVELHIALLREWILRSSLPLVEIPPVPAGGSFIACLTHDVDHVGVRNHRFDATMWGFVGRGLAGSLWDLARGRKTLVQCARNWTAVFSLPLVHLGWVRDFWYQFDRYQEIERGLSSTFFVIPQKGDPGTDAEGRIRPLRAARYGAADIRDDVRKLHADGWEIGVHGINAWRDSECGKQERDRVAEAAGHSPSGVRMHWLYFRKESPRVLEQAGFDYDSTMGFNQTIGYRAGTAQVFKPLQTENLLELPMHVMDTALFYPSYLNCSPRQAKVKVEELIGNSIRLGGVLTINWHDRSVAPERLWDGFYIELLKDLRRRKAVFLTAGQTVRWFRKRRAAKIDQVEFQNGTVRNRATRDASQDGLPGLILRVHKPRKPGAAGYSDIPLPSGSEISLAV